MIDSLYQSSSVPRRSHVPVVFTNGRRHTAHHFDTDGILRVVLATFRDLELHLNSQQLPSHN